MEPLHIYDLLGALTKHTTTENALALAVMAEAFKLLDRKQLEHLKRECARVGFDRAIELTQGEWSNWDKAVKV